MVVGADVSRVVERRTGVSVVSAVVALAVVVRVGALWWHGALGSSFGFDEAVYFIGAQHLWSGELPYRDFLFVHPPGMLVALIPAAWLADLVGDSNAMAAAKVVFALVGAACAGLVAWLLLRFGATAALFGGGLYAVWSAAVWGETMLMMGPLLNLGLLVALVLLRRPEGALVGGVVFGLAVTVKLWALVPLVVAGIWVLARYGRAPMMRFAAGAVAAAAVIVAAFLIAAPGRMFTDVVGFQSGRPRSDTGLGERVFFFTGSLIGYERIPNLGWLVVGLVGVVAVALPMIRVLRARVAVALWDEPVLWSVLALAQLGALAAAPSFYHHYTGFAVPALCLLAGYGVHVLWENVSGIRVRRLVAVVAVVGLAALAMASVRVVSGGHAQPLELAAVAAGRDCVWMHDPAALIEADISGRQIGRGCPMFVDRYASALVEVAVVDADLIDALPAAAGYQRAIVEQFRGSDVVLISEYQLTELAPGTVAVLHTEFARSGEVGRYELWERTTN